ncbi:MAG TPA: carbamoyltransferase C-terminal domain-containing protein [Solirubrobacteraceae bacterium]|nr:carbamoyltransferase C-terminal domain-containing protein [Solirubrobacteraceae bacterium]
MDDAPTVVGINRTQDASIAVARGRSHVASLQKERLTRRKHHWGRLGDVRDRYVPSLPELREPVDLVVECYSSDTEVANRDAYHQELAESLRFRGEMRVEQVSHHLAHLYSAFHPSPFDAAAVMVIDAQGSRVRDISEPFPDAAAAAPDLLEIASFYDCDRGGRADCIGKQLWDGDWNRPAGLGCFYYLLTRMIFPTGEGNEGKVMGLAPFGRRGALGLPELVVDEYRVLIPDEWRELFAERDERFLVPTGNGASIDDSANLAAAGQHAFESALLRVARWLAEETGRTDLCYAGGAALNCSANGRLVRESAFRGVFIPPSPHDGGTAVGCALYGMIGVLGQPSDFRWSHDFLGPELDEAALEATLGEAGDDLVVERPDDLLERVVEILDGGGVVAVHTGRSESGPRALGNRSILADARHPAMQDHINFHVKGREWFRPLAPIVLLGAAPAIFDIDRPSPFMQIAADVRPEYREQLPAITHVDGTARLQSVEAESTPFLHALLERFEERTGCPVLLNTSLNGKGDPLTETPADSLECFRTTAMHALVLPPFLVRKRDEPPRVARSEA